MNVPALFDVALPSIVSSPESWRPKQHHVSYPIVITALHLRYHSLGMRRDPVEPDLLGGIFLLAGERALEICMEDEADSDIAVLQPVF
jgi:hypothetical protein